MNITFSPPDITEDEIQEVCEALRSGWITTGPRTKEFERLIAERCHTQKAACLSSATAGMELTLRVMGMVRARRLHDGIYVYSDVQCHLPCWSDSGSGRYGSGKL